MFESASDPLLPFEKFVQRMMRSVATILILVAISLAVGVMGYRITEHMSWIDAFYNASMILGGMGPAADLHSDGAKIFASLYALYSGLFVIAAMGIFLVPLFHRTLHKFHQKR